MDTRILFGHEIQNPRLERLVEQQVRSIDKYTYRATRITIVIDVINNADKVCHISLQVAGESAVSVCKVRPGVMMAIMSAFEELEETLQHKLIEKTHWGQPAHSGYYFTAPGTPPGTLSYEEPNRSFYLPPRPAVQAHRRMRRH